MAFLEAALVRDAVLMFILTIFIFSLLVTEILRFFIAISARRRGYLREMLEEFFRFEFQPVIQRELQRLRQQLKLGEKLVSELNRKAGNFNTNVSFENMAKLADVSTEELIERLKRSEFGHQLLMELGDKAQNVFDELGKRYEVVRDRFSKSSREQHRRWAAIIALFLAFVFNVDSIFIANTYLNYEGASQAIATQRDAFVRDYEALAQTLEKEQGKYSFTKADLEQAFKNSREQLNSVTVRGIPVGWYYFPHSALVAPEERSEDYQYRNSLLGWLLWLIGIMITAYIAGIGAPFWYDVSVGIKLAVQGAARKPKK